MPSKIYNKLATQNPIVKEVVSTCMDPRILPELFESIFPGRFIIRVAGGMIQSPGVDMTTDDHLAITKNGEFGRFMVMAHSDCAAGKMAGKGAIRNPVLNEGWKQWQEQQDACKQRDAETIDRCVDSLFSSQRGLGLMVPPHSRENIRAIIAPAKTPGKKPLTQPGRELLYLIIPFLGEEINAGFSPLFAERSGHVASASLKGETRWCIFPDVKAESSLSEKTLQFLNHLFG